jgi:hypothetical protein
MATSRISSLIQHVRGTLLGRDGAGFTDAKLLECFVTGRDDAAFYRPGAPSRPARLGPR